MSKTAAILVMMAFVACSAGARAQPLGLQERCAADARQAFHELEDEYRARFEQSTQVQKSVGNYQSHYSPKLNRCLMLVDRRSVLSLSTTPSDQQREALLIDANERRYYALYIETQLAAEAQPKIEKCELTPTMRARTTCTTRGEFDAFVADYLEQ